MEHEKVERRRIIVVQHLPNSRAYIVYGLDRRASLAFELGEVEGMHFNEVREHDGIIAAYKIPFAIVSDYDLLPRVSYAEFRRVGCVEIPAVGYTDSHTLAVSVSEIVHSSESIRDYFRLYYGDAPAHPGQSDRRTSCQEQSISGTSTG